MKHTCHARAWPKFRKTPRSWAFQLAKSNNEMLNASNSKCNRSAIMILFLSHCFKRTTWQYLLSSCIAIHAQIENTISEETLHSRRREACYVVCVVLLLGPASRVNTLLYRTRASRADLLILWPKVLKVQCRSTWHGMGISFYNTYHRPSVRLVTQAT